MTEIFPVALEDILDLRDRLLSPGHPGRPVIWPYDNEAAVHYGAFTTAHDLIGCLSTCPGSMEHDDRSASFRFHSMAVENP